mgnify:CR=1 FL=1
MSPKWFARKRVSAGRNDMEELKWDFAFLTICVCALAAVAIFEDGGSEPDTSRLDRIEQRIEALEQAQKVEVEDEMD